MITDLLPGIRYTTQRLADYLLLHFCDVTVIHIYCHITVDIESVIELDIITSVKRLTHRLKFRILNSQLFKF